MKKTITLFIMMLIININIFSANFITTAQSISWSGAYTTVADGFEAMLYNPAGIYKTNKTMGLNIFGSYALRYYNNTFSTDDVIKFFSGDDVTELFRAKLKTLSDLNMNFDMGVELSMFNIMFYKNLKDFGIGVSFIPRTYMTMTFSRSFVDAVFKGIDFNDPIKFTMSTTIMNYLDLNVSLSTRVKFLEKAIPIFDMIYAGMSTHVYLPTTFFNLTASGEVYKGSPDPGAFDDIFKNMYPINIRLSGNAQTSGIVNGALASSISSFGNKQVDSLFLQKDVYGFGLGFDFGFILVFRKIFNFGFSVTDLGFITFPKAASIGLSVDLPIMEASKIMDELDVEANTDSGVTWMPNTTLRIGASYKPFEKKYFDFLIALDLSVSDLYRCLNEGEYATFNFATGAEFRVKVGIVQFPLRFVFSYNTQANVAIFSTGIGLYVGPVEMELAIKGLEALIDGWGAKDIQMGMDFKFEIDKNTKPKTKKVKNTE